jgi:nitroimidazol reductase NimA-like FMN-containing flavoprotein (pyridoxamine 5'-phosphate oxidase superfamily)
MTMIGILSQDEIAQLLQRHRVGRIGCSANDRPYIVPINYVYQCDAIYAYSMPGRKINIMREQPLVSFEVDEIDGPSNWRSVIAEGVYEELTESERSSLAKRLLVNGFGTLVSRGLDASSPIVLFRIRITELSGRFERRDA